MTREEIAEYCESLPGTEEHFQEEWGCFLYRIDGKFFAMIGEDKKGAGIISLKCDPFRAEELRSAFPEDIKEGYYLSKKHWNSIKIDNSLDDKLMKELIEHSYDLVFKKLTKSAQKKIKEKG